MTQNSRVLSRWKLALKCKLKLELKYEAWTCSAWPQVLRVMASVKVVWSLASHCSSVCVCVDTRYSTTNGLLFSDITTAVAQLLLHIYFSSTE